MLWKELGLNVLAGSLTTSFSVAVWNPLDTIRIRWQVSAQNQNGGLIKFSQDIIAKEGLWRGLWRPGLTGHMSAVAVSSGIRLGFYPYIRDHLAGGDAKNKHAGHMWLAGLLAGGFGFFLANPLFQGKVRLQASNSEEPLRHCLQKMWREEGIKGLYRGSSTLVVRGALLSAGAQLGYDFTKTQMKAHHIMNDGPFLHVLASVASAFLASVFSAPADLVMTKYQAAPALGVKDLTLRRCIVQIFQEYGLQGFYRGWLPYFLRLCPLFVMNLPLYEQVRLLLGLKYLN